MQTLFSATLRIVIRVVDEENLDATVQVIITFTDINDNSPIITNLPHSVVLFEVSRKTLHWVDHEVYSIACGNRILEWKLQFIELMRKIMTCHETQQFSISFWYD